MSLDATYVLRDLQKRLKFKNNEVEDLIKSKNFIILGKTGITWVIYKLIKKNNLDLFGDDELDEAMICQWLEYISITFLSSYRFDSLTVLKDLDNILSDRVYLVKYSISVADIILYLVLYAILKTIPETERAEYVNVCRWFDNLQQDPNIRQDNCWLSFYRTLYT